MPDRPSLLLPAATVRERTRGRGGRTDVRGPGRGTQGSRLDPKFGRLTTAFDNERLRLSQTPEALEPEQILVFEIAGELSDFRDSVDRISGLEWLAEQLDEEPTEPTPEFARVDAEERRKPFRRELFVIASDARAWTELTSLWRRFKAGDNLAGQAPLRHLFERLIDVREWDDRDRLLRGGAGPTWQQELAGLRDQVVPFELELWLRSDESKRGQIVNELRRELRAAGGGIQDEALIPEIDYHGVLGSAPARLLLDAAGREEVQWLSTQNVRLFHAVGQIVAPEPSETETPESETDFRGPPPVTDRTRIALLEGLPVANHQALENRSVLDDPEDWSSTEPVADRRHGTAMCSLAARGDLSDSAAEPLNERVYLRPILRREAPDWVSGAGERVPSDRLIVDFLHLAVRRILVDDGGAAPDTRVIALSVGDASQQFDRFVSPLARLLDWLSFEQSVLFLVSAGNHVAPYTVPGDVDLDDVAELQAEVLDAKRREALSRRLLSPAESVNALTIGSAHGDRSEALVDAGRLEAVTTSDLPSVISPVSSGARRAIKPETLYPGGRQLLQRPLPGVGGSTIELPVAVTTRAPGLRVAAPDPAGALDTTEHVCGTSAANAMAARTAGLLLSELDDLRAREPDRAPPENLDALLLKALLVHSARWREASDVIAHMLRDAGETSGKEALARFLGYGAADPDWRARSDDHRVTLMQAATINADDAHEYEMPVPAALMGTTVRRRFSATLAWLTPINPAHRNYRRAALALDLPAGRDGVFGERTEASSYAARRGTLQHEHLVGARAVPSRDNASEPLVVSCRADAGDLVSPVPYAIVVTVEVPADAGLQIYEQVRDRLRARIPVRP